MPPARVHRNASVNPPSVLASPTMTEPLLDAALACASGVDGIIQRNEGNSELIRLAEGIQRRLCKLRPKRSIFTTPKR